jgi:hypothetical protein
LVRSKEIFRSDQESALVKLVRAKVIRHTIVTKLAIHKVNINTELGVVGANSSFNIGKPVRRIEGGKVPYTR